MKRNRSVRYFTMLVFLFALLVCYRSPGQVYSNKVADEKQQSIADNRALKREGSFLNNMNEALNDNQKASVQYSLNKRPKDMWNFIVGTQFQHNKHWMIRDEYGFWVHETYSSGLQYRFGL